MLLWECPYIIFPTTASERGLKVQTLATLQVLAGEKRQDNKPKGKP